MPSKKRILDYVTIIQLVHLTAWIWATVSVNVALNDFVMMRLLLGYSKVIFYSATSTSVGMYLRYLSEELRALALLDSRVKDICQKNHLNWVRSRWRNYESLSELMLSEISNDDDRDENDRDDYFRYISKNISKCKGEI